MARNDDSIDFASGFSVVLNKVDAMLQEMRQTNQILVRALDIKAKYAGTAADRAAAASGAGGVRANSGPAAGATTVDQLQAVDLSRYDTTRYGAQQAAYDQMLLGGGGGRPQTTYTSGPVGGSNAPIDPTAGTTRSAPGRPAAGGGGRQGPPAGGTYTVIPAGGDPDHQGGLGAQARNSIPFVSRGVGAILGEIRSQREKNMRYQSIEGGSNVSGFKERMHEFVYGLSTAGVFGGAEASKAFYGATQMGYNGKQTEGMTRQDALNFMYHGKTARGSTIEESQTQLAVASRNAMINFNDLSSALDKVSEAAGKAGVNAQIAREQFTQSMATGIQQGYGAGSVSYSQNVIQTKASWGRDMSSLDLSNRMGAQFQYMAASAAGMTRGQYMADRRAGGTASAAADYKWDMRTIGNAINVEWVKSKILEIGGSAVIKANPNRATDIASEYIQQFQPDPAVVQAKLAPLSGLPADTPYDQLIKWAVEQIAGNTELQTAANNKPTTMSDLSTLGTGQVGDKPRTRGEAISKTAGRLNKDSIAAYKAMVSAGGTQHASIEQLINNNVNDKAHVIVSTDQGDREVTMAEAIQYYPTQLANGTAKNVDGSPVITAGAQETNLKTSDAEYKKTDIGKAYDAASANAAAGGTGAVTVGLTPEAQRLLRIVTPDEQADAAGFPR